MFAQYRFIDPIHHVTLESCIRTHPVVTAQLLAKLYRVAGGSVEPGVAASQIKTADYTVGTATDEKTGIYLQLVEFENKPNALLTVGQKWAMERENTVQGNISTLFW